jgi:hypothetical protein
MAFGLVGSRGEVGKDISGYTPEYVSYIRAWQDRSLVLDRNIGYIDCHVVHHFHGPMSKRQYQTRDQILIGNKYNPYTDIFPDWQGVYQLTNEKPKMRDEIRRHFLERCEDEPLLPQNK